MLRGVDRGLECLLLNIPEASCPRLSPDLEEGDALKPGVGVSSLYD